MSEFPELGFYALAGHADSSRDLLQEVSDGEAMGLGTVFISERYTFCDHAALSPSPTQSPSADHHRLLIITVC